MTASTSPDSASSSTRLPRARGMTGADALRAHPSETHFQTPPFREADGMFTQSFAAKWGRRLLSIPAQFVGTALDLALMPVLIPYAAARDVASGRKGFLRLRFHLFIAAVLVMQSWSLLCLGGTWLRTRFMSPARRRKVNLDLERFCIPRILATAELIYDQSYEVDGDECATQGPYLLFSRHASIIDTILPIKLLSTPHHVGLRIVQKAELLWNPVVDLASHRMPRAFVKRGSGKPEQQAELMVKLMEGMGAQEALKDEALLVFPEGSRFTREKQQRVVAKIAERSPKAAEQAAALKSVLPVRPAGPAKLMDARPDLDVVFLAHTGLEKANRLEDFVSGALYKRKVKVKFWRVKAADIPSDPEERAVWLQREWARVDEWIVKNRDPDMVV